jgi:hypothetical protein
MTEEQKTHAAQLGDEAERRLLIKYAKGAAEHGGNIWELSPMVLLEEAINEAIDQVVYLMTLKQQLEAKEQ